MASARDWACLMRRIAPPDVLVCDGGGGIESARRGAWPETGVQRCAFHAFCQVKRCITTRPKRQAGVDLYAIARDLLHVKDGAGAAERMARYQGWRTDYDGFLGEHSEADARRYKHERLRKARRGHRLERVPYADGIQAVNNPRRHTWTPRGRRPRPCKKRSRRREGG